MWHSSQLYIKWSCLCSTNHLVVFQPPPPRPQTIHNSSRYINEMTVSMMFSEENNIWSRISHESWVTPVVCLSEMWKGVANLLSVADGPMITHLPFPRLSLARPVGGGARGDVKTWTGSVWQPFSRLPLCQWVSSLIELDRSVWIFLR